jgi:type II secretory pathway pseudopilin PulG
VDLMPKKKKKGFTLLEMIIVVALTVVIIGIVSSIFITGNRVFTDSDIKSTLQIQGQVIQEKISSIGMQAGGIKSVIGNESTGEIQNIKINSYDKDGNKKVFEINNQPPKLFIDGEQVSGNVESIKIDSQIIKDYNKDPNLLESRSDINFTITLSKIRNYDNTKITYPVNIQTVFRNKNALGS